MVNRPKHLREIVPIYDFEDSKYPTSIRLSFDDGHTMIYDLRFRGVPPVIVKNVEIIKRMNQNVYGYQRREKGKHENRSFGARKCKKG